MKNIIKGIFKRDSKSAVRELTHPKQLQIGDLLKVDDSFVLPTSLSAKTLKVVDVYTYQFEYEHFTEWVLQNELGEALFLGIEQEDGAELASWSIKIPRADVEALFDMDEFAQIFEQGPAELTRVTVQDQMEKWLAPAYHQNEFACRGYFYQQDYRGSRPPDEEGEGEPFDYYSLISDDGTKAIEIEVWDGGETDVMLTLYRPIADIRELWPK